MESRGKTNLLPVRKTKRQRDGTCNGRLLRRASWVALGMLGLLGLLGLRFLVPTGSNAAPEYVRVSTGGNVSRYSSPSLWRRDITNELDRGFVVVGSAAMFAERKFFRDAA